MKLAAVCLLGGWVLGCAPGVVDYSALESAARERQRHAGAVGPAERQSVRELLARRLDAQAAAQVALLNNPGVRALGEEVSVALANLTRARHLPNPTLHGAIRFHPGTTPELDVGAMLNISDLLLLAARSGAAESEVEAAKLVAVGNLLDLAFDARRTFIEYQAALQTLELERSAVSAFTASSSAAERLREAGNITQLALAGEQAALADARLGLERSEREVLVLREKLNGLMGLSGPSTTWQAEPKLPELPATELALADLEAESVRRSLDLEIAKQRFAIATRRASLARAAGLIPEIKAGVSAERHEEWALGPAVEVGLPFFYQGQGEVAAATAESRAQRHVFADAAVRLRAAARVAAAELVASRNRALYQRDVVLPLKQQIVDETQLHYNGMLVGVFQLLQAKREQIAARLSHIDELRQYWLARSNVEALRAGRMAAPTGRSTRPSSQPAPSMPHD